MSYKSDVVIYLKETDKKLEDIVKEIKKIEDIGIYSIGKNSNEERILNIEYECIKWYEEYDLPKYLLELMEKAGEENYLFVYKGEEYEDVETKGNLGCGWISRKIMVDIDFCEIPESGLFKELRTGE